MADDETLKMLSTHPCYNEEAHRKYARMHVPVAPRCNIQCNYCNRKYDCSNESRPGVTSDILTPEEAADKIAYVRERIPELKVIGIAGPGDALANESTFKTLELVKERFPDLTLCVSTNGLMLPEYAQRLYDLNVRFVTVTMNACDPSVSEKIYSTVIWEGKRLTGRPAAEKLLERQLEGIKKSADLGMLVKVNIVMIPEINQDHIPDLVRKVRSLGAHIVNILPLIPVEGTKFADLRAPTPEERRKLMDDCSADAKMMRHCKQCRADAIGMLSDDRSAEFAGCGKKGCGPAKERVSDIMEKEEVKVAAASSDGKSIDGGFGNTEAFRIYASDGETARFLREVRMDTSTQLSMGDHADHVSRSVEAVRGSDAVVVREIGHRPADELERLGIILEISKGDALTAVLKAAARARKALSGKGV